MTDEPAANAVSSLSTAPKIDASPPRQQCQGGRREETTEAASGRQPLLPDLSPTATSVCQSSFAERHCYEQFYPRGRRVGGRRHLPTSDDNTSLMPSCTYDVINERATRTDLGTARPLPTNIHSLRNRSAAICRHYSPSRGLP